MARLVLKIDVDASKSLDDPHDIIEDILAYADQLPTFKPGESFVIKDYNIVIQSGTFDSCEWEE
jgi:hypothetical protein